MPYADKCGYLGDFLLSQCATNKLDYFSMRRVISHRVRLSLIVFFFFIYVPKNGLKYPELIFNIFSMEKEVFVWCNSDQIEFPQQQEIFILLDNIHISVITFPRPDEISPLGTFNDYDF